MSDFYISGGELHHYGVVGMKWGVRRGKTQSAYDKASKKLNKLTAKVDKAEDKSRKKFATLNKKAGSFFSTPASVNKARAKASKAQSKANRRMQKAADWVTKMEKTFADTPISLSKKQIDIGQRYVNTLNERAERRMVL